MTDKKYTDEEIIKAEDVLKKLEEAYNAYYDTSKGMPYDIDKTIRESAICIEDAIKEINRLKAENERLQWGEYRHIGKTVKNARREGIEDAFDRLRNIISLHTENHISLGLKDIDLIESEMVGEDE